MCSSEMAYTTPRLPHQAFISVAQNGMAEEDMAPAASSQKEINYTYWLR